MARTFDPQQQWFDTACHPSRLDFPSIVRVGLTIHFGYWPDSCFPKRPTFFFLTPDKKMSNWLKHCHGNGCPEPIRDWMDARTTTPAWPEQTNYDYLKLTAKDKTKKETQLFIHKFRFYWLTDNPFRHTISQIWTKIVPLYQRRRRKADRSLFLLSNQLWSPEAQEKVSA